MLMKFLWSVQERLTGECILSYFSVSLSGIPDFFGEIDFQSIEELVVLIPLVEFLAL
jgi:hypothetical protein